MADRKKPASKSPTQRTLAWLRGSGWTCAITEHWNPHAHIRQDLFGVIDVLAISKDKGCLGVQACTGTDTARRLGKVLAEPRAKLWIEAGNKLWVIGWRKLKASNRWEPDIRDITIGMFED